MCHGMAVCEPFENVLQVGIGLDVVELCGGDERGDDGPAVGASIGAGKEMVLAPEGDRPDRALDCVGVEFDTPILEEATESGLSGKRIANGLGKCAARRQPGELAFKPGLHCLDKRT